MMVHIRRIREKMHEQPRNPKFIRRCGEWGIKLKNSLRRFKIRLFLELSLQIVGAILLLYLGLRLVDGILNDFIANFLFSLDSAVSVLRTQQSGAVVFNRFRHDYDRHLFYDP